MSSNETKAAWNPAFMPDATPDQAAAPAEKSEPATSPSAKADSAQTASAPAPVATFDGPSDNDGGDAWFPEYDASSATPVAEKPTEAPQTAANQPHHQTTSSFARTVSNDVNWDNEDDDSEFTLPRANTDPFKFMAPSDRTNSFPVVPSPHAEAESRPKAETMVAIQEDGEVAAAKAAQPAAAEGAWDSGAEEHDADHAFFDGNGVPDERFEEGVPLIQQGQDAVTTPKEAEPKKQTTDLFADDEADGDDDFFSSTKPAADEQKPAFERKSTMQVLNSMNVGTLAREDSAPGSIAEESEPAEAETKQPADASSNPNGESAEDLAAKWAAALADAEDDDDLLEDSALETGDETQTKELDPAAVFGDDDDGFLDDDFLEDTPAQPQTQPANQPSAPQTPSAYPATSRYIPQAPQPTQPQQQTTPQQQTNPYFPSTPFTPAQSVAPNPYSAAVQSPGAASPYGAPPQPQQPPAANKAQSFVDKSKGGYHSPYDLPMDVVKPPRKRQSMQQLHRPNETAPTLAPRPPPPARSSSLHVPTSPLKESFSADSPPAAAAGAATAAPATAPPPKNNDHFFEDLPILPKPRPASRPASRPGSRHGQTAQYASPPPPMPATVPHAANQYAPPPLAAATASASSTMPPPPPTVHYTPASAVPAQSSAPTPQPAAPEIAKLVAPPRVNPYAPVSQGSGLRQSSVSVPNSAPGPTLSRYASSPNLQSGAVPALQPNRYSPALATRVPSGGMGPPPVLPHQPRTSSPLAHFEMSYEKPRGSSVGHSFMLGEGPPLSERRNSSSIYEPRLNRVPSLPPTREVEEEDGAPKRPSTSGGFQHTSPPPMFGSYSPQRLHQQTPSSGQAANTLHGSTLSPPKRILNYMPQEAEPAQSSPPPRAQTQSPGSMNKYAPHPVTHVRRPSSAHEAAAPSRARASSILNLVPPTDGTEADDLRRWKGAPVFAWGMGGTFVSSYPQDVPRYGMNQAMPAIYRAPGEVQVKNIKELYPVEERLAKFPGPLKGKGKKKEVLAWLTAGIEGLEQSLPQATFPPSGSVEDKRLEEKVLLWKLVRVFIEHDGVLEGNLAVDKAVRAILSPYTPDELSVATATPSTPASAGLGLSGFPGAGPGGSSSTPPPASDAVDSTTLEQIRKDLLLGDKEKAAWDAVDKRLWGHAFLVASAASRELFKQVAQEFVRKEVNGVGVNNESLAALYEVLSGNHEECVDELVPVHARAGLQLVSTESTTMTAKDALAGLDKWRETLCLILSNRSPDDVHAIHSLGKLLAGYGRAEAAHVCFLFSRQVTVFGGLDDPAASFVLLGADPEAASTAQGAQASGADHLAKQMDAVLLSEVYEYGLALAAAGSGAAAAAAAGCPHLAAYKLQHALRLAEHGLQDKALQYCEALLAAFGAQTRRSPYYHAALEATVEDLAKRLKQAPREESGSSWIPKPNMNKVSDTVWNRFNKFVAGEDGDGAGTGNGGGFSRGSDGEGGLGSGGMDGGPFARLASGTPTISRPPSSGGGGAGTGMEMFGGATSSYAEPTMYGRSPSVPATARGTSSRYAPSASGNPYEAMNGGGGGGGSYASPPETTSAYVAPEHRLARQSSEMSMSLLYGDSHSNYVPRQGLSRKSSYAPLGVGDGAATTPSAVPGYNPYEPTASEPVQVPSSPEKRAAAAATANSHGYNSYQSSSYGYEPPAMVVSSYEPAGADGRPSTAPVAGQQQQQSSSEQQQSAYSSSYDPPSFQPYSYEPPSYEPAADTTTDGAAEESADEAPKPKKKDYFDEVDGGDDDIPALRKPAEQKKTKEQMDREAEERFRQAAEEDAKRAEAEKAAKAKKGWGLTSWFKKEAAPAAAGTADDGAPKAIKANLGEKNSFYYDPELKRWVNKNANPTDQAKSAPPPPPPRSQSATRVPSGGSDAHTSASMPTGMPTPMTPTSAPGGPGGPGGPGSLGSTPPPLAPPLMRRTASGTSTASGPSSRPSTAMGEATSIEDLLGAAAAGGSRKGAKRGRKGGRYVDVMAK